MLLSMGLDLRLLRLLFCISLVFNVQAAEAKKDLKSACSTCRQITDNFNKGFDKTAKQNFGGGNTAWEERKLSKYETSEIRLMEIIEGLCESSSFECNHMLEEHEEHLKLGGSKGKQKIQICTSGSALRPSKFAVLRELLDQIAMVRPTAAFHVYLFCWSVFKFVFQLVLEALRGHVMGMDSVMEMGLEEGMGSAAVTLDMKESSAWTVLMDTLMKSETTLSLSAQVLCIVPHGLRINATTEVSKWILNCLYLFMTECHLSCKTCNGPTHQDCDECKDGWEEDDNEACIDVNECIKEPSPCKEDEHCLNTEGSFSCKACDKVCSGCTGPGPENCKTCASGYQDKDGHCTDVDECSQEEPVCTKEHQDCVNTKGSFLCICAYGYEEKEGECVQKLQTEKEPAEATLEPTETSDHVEL
ncbi:hypothetical protein WMY93_021482 [Mugilogobius chulae]|uniref:EGF-like domain-containing protein n=1 Tax=Mugilogobius chulae TaxID=88201 RepID=A0AAW0NFS2_9GOBI